MISLYIHIPFCQRKCFYCSFVVAIGQDDRIDSYLECLTQEAEKHPSTPLKTIYVGGGTPTHMNLKQLERLFAILRSTFQFSPDCEFTIEANPEGLELVKAKFLRDSGVNRVSLGVQSLNDSYLKYLGRVHDARQAIIAFENLRKAGFANINLDLMYSFPGQTFEEIERDVKAIVALGSEHLSLYTLTIEENSKFYARRLKLDEGEIQAWQYQLVVSLLKPTEFEQYEISNFAKSDCRSRHNLNYWEGGDYIGLGVGSHSHLQGRRSWNVSKTAAYMSRIKDGESPLEGEEWLPPSEQLRERILFGLRMNQGIDVPALSRTVGVSLDSDGKEKITQLIEGGFLFWEDSRLCATDKGRMVLDEIGALLI